MLGDLIGEEQGQVIVQRVLAEEHGLPPAVETTFRAAGTLLGVAVNDMGSYTARLRPDGTLAGSGQGILMSPDGSHASWSGQGVGQFTGDGGVSWRGSIIYSSDSPAFAGLRGVAGVFEFETDSAGTTTGKLWAWK
ncbi:hypothetical protein [Kitasatospora azatica]|uniref:hypothetical protein n=1 Tax=Kitasatospora azatica TaxID=58347 RepID=UPI00055FD3B2|nr:hypothetical protein [Kitasatospora azatica]